MERGIFKSSHIFGGVITPECLKIPRKRSKIRNLEPNLSYYDWLIAKYEGLDTPRGDLAMDVAREDKVKLPVSSDLKSWMDYMDKVNAYYRVKEILVDTFKDYKRYLLKARVLDNA